MVKREGKFKQQSFGFGAIRRLSLSLRKFPMWEHRLHLAQALPVTGYVGSFLLPVICRCWLQFCSWVNEEGILKYTVSPSPTPPLPPGSLFWNRMGRPSHTYMIWWQVNLQNSRISWTKLRLQTLKIIRFCCRTSGGRLSEYWRIRTLSEKYSR